MNKVYLFNLSLNALRSGSVFIETDKGNFELSQNSLENVFARFSLSVFDKGGETAYKTVLIDCKTDLVLYRISFIISKPKNQKEFVFYKTFINAPAAGFLRCGKFGFYTGAVNSASIRERKTHFFR